MEREEIEIDGKKFEAEVADNLFTRAKGLSFRSEGKMLFKFPRDTRGKIDMVFLSRPLYLYFMNSEGEVIDVQEAEPWTFDPRSWRLYSPGRPYRFLLESFEELDVKEGDFMEFSGVR
jgi:uncharacterized membrane protein (UPF0127 family)